MTDLAEFLLARIAEDEAWVGGEDGEYLDGCQECAFGQQPESPYSRTRVLAECAAKRRIVELHRSEEAEGVTVCAECGPEEDVRFRVETRGRGYPCQTLRFLALPYADYLPEWRPGS